MILTALNGTLGAALNGTLGAAPSPSPDDSIVEEGAAQVFHFWEWFVGYPVQVLAILAGGILALFLVRRAITTVTERIASGYHRAYVDTLEDTDGEEDLSETKVLKFRREKRRVLIEDAGVGAIASLAAKQRRAQRAQTVGSVLNSAANIIIISVMVVLILNAVGESGVVGPILASAGVVGVAIGFGAQSLVRDFLSGVFILIEDQYGVGDAVDLGGGADGIVEKMDLRLTHVRAFDGTLWHVRNGEVLRAGNHTQQWSRAVAEIAVPIGSDLAVVRAALRRAVKTVISEDLDVNLLETPDIRGIDAVRDGNYIFTVHGKVLPGMDGAVARDMRTAATAELIAAGILGEPPAIEPEGGPAAMPAVIPLGTVPSSSHAPDSQAPDSDSEHGADGHGAEHGAEQGGHPEPELIHDLSPANPDGPLVPRKSVLDS
jgi:small conductance mechanosensitive channel